MKNRVGLGSQYLLLVVQSGYMWGGASDETETLCHSRCGMKKCNFFTERLGAPAIQCMSGTFNQPINK